MGSNYSCRLKKVLQIQKIIQDIHPFLERAFPIAVVEAGYFWIYDFEPDRQQYEFIKKAALPMQVPQGVRAAFGLESYANRMACVVSGDVFDELDGYAIIFHEFIHCQQFETCEGRLKEMLQIACKARVAGDFMWEINHPFPYTAPGFIKLYNAFLVAQELHEIELIQHQLKANLSVEDYEYMVWQEWKEGFARFIENQIRNKLSIPENHGGKEKPFNRVVFYEGGSNYIQALSQQEPELVIDIERLFKRIFQG